MGKQKAKMRKHNKQFYLLKKTLLESGYEVRLVNSARKGAMKPYTIARPTKGYIVPDDLTIYIDRNLGLNDRVVTLIHELLHEIHPHWEETRVEIESRRIFNNLNVSQLGFLQFFVLGKRDIKNFMEGRQRVALVVA